MFFFQTTVQIPQFFHVKFVVSRNNTKQVIALTLADFFVHTCMSSKEESHTKYDMTSSDVIIFTYLQQGNLSAILTLPSQGQFLD
jgi:hypothetical protein